MWSNFILYKILTSGDVNTFGFFSPNSTGKALKEVENIFLDMIWRFKLTAMVDDR